MMTNRPATEILFYQLARASLERVLPDLLAKTLERGWRAVVQAASEERIEALDGLLWTYRDDAFLPHGTAKDGNSERQPVFLTADDANPNGSQVRFLVDGADCDDLAGYARVVYLFDGGDEEMAARARAQWSAAKAAGHDVTYWVQNARGAWEKKP